MSDAVYIVTPCYNMVKTIDETIWSILSQAGKEFSLRYHVQDGGSSDGTLEKLRAWEKRCLDNPDFLPNCVFTYASEPDNGMYDAIARGIARLDIPETAFMGWLNGDDTLWSGALAAIARLAIQIPEVDWVMGWPCWLDECGRFTHIDRSLVYPQSILASGLADGLHWQFIQQESTFWRKRIWNAVGGIDATLKNAGDWDLWYRFAQKTPLVHMQRQLGAFRVRPGQKSSDLSKYRQEMEKILPITIRQKNFNKILKDKKNLQSVLVAWQDQDGIWRQDIRRNSGKYQKFVRKLFCRFPKLGLKLKIIRELLLKR